MECVPNRAQTGIPVGYFLFKLITRRDVCCEEREEDIQDVMRRFRRDKVLKRLS